MLIDRTHKRWFVGSALLVGIGAVAYCGIGLTSIHGPTGGGLLGLIFGIIGSAFMVFAALLAVRRRLPTWRIGFAQFWVRGHLWLGTVGFVLILFHSGFGWGGLLENLLWISFGLVVVTGFFGVAVQQVIPRLLMSEVPLETMVSQIPTLSNMSVFKADKIVASKVGLLDLDFEPLKPHALNVLKRQEQSIGERPEDFPRELAKTYANVPIPESEKKKPPPPTPKAASEPGPAASKPPVAAADATAAAKPKSPLELMREKNAGKAVGETAAKPKSPLELMREKAAAKDAGDGAAKPKSPLELMREKNAAKAAVVEAPKPAPAPEPEAPPPEMMLSMLEGLQGLQTIAQPASKPSNRLISITCAQCGQQFKVNARHAGKMGRCTNDECKAPYTVPTTEEEVPVEATMFVPVSEPSVPEPEPQKKLSPLEQMRAKQAAAAATASPSDNPSAKPLSPIEQMRAKQAAAAAQAPATENPSAKPLSPIEQMRAKQAAAAVAQAPASDNPSAKPLSPIEQMRAKQAAAAGTAPSSDSAPAKPLSPIEQMRAKKLEAAKGSPAAQPEGTPKPLTVEKPSAPPAVKKPPVAAKPTAEKPAAAPAKSKPTPVAQIPAALLDELRDFHIQIVRPFLFAGKSPKHRMDDGATARRLFAQLRSDLPAELHESVEQIEALCEERRQYNTQLRLHHWLHWWLIVHIPSSIALLVLFVVHVVVSLRVVPFGH